jgi:hypothetical protein
LILYKYYSFSCGKLALESENLGFRTPNFFNDPFEASVICSDQEIETSFNEILKNVVILSLTRTPLNALMWAHYGEEHKGFVIGYDVDDQFFKCKTNNLIPIQQGNVIYTKTKPIINISEFFLNELDNHIKGLVSEFEDDKYSTKSLVSHLFLNKDTIWSYEEEVRLVKPIIDWTTEHEQFLNNPFNQHSIPSREKEIMPGCFKIEEETPGLKIYSYPVKIKEVYLGYRNDCIKNQDEKVIKLLRNLRIKGCQVYSISNDKTSWDLIKRELNDF